MVKTVLAEKYSNTHKKMYVSTRLLFSFVFILIRFDTQDFLAEGLNLGCAKAKSCPFCFVPEL